MAYFELSDSGIETVGGLIRRHTATCSAALYTSDAARARPDSPFWGIDPLSKRMPTEIPEHVARCMFPGHTASERRRFAADAGETTDLSDSCFKLSRNFAITCRLLYWGLGGATRCPDCRRRMVMRVTTVRIRRLTLTETQQDAASPTPFLSFCLLPRPLNCVPHRIGP